MTDKELVISTLDFLKNKGYQNLEETFWKDFDSSIRIRLKNVLLKNKFIRLADGEPFTFEITTEGSFIKAKELYEDGLLISLHPLTEIEIKLLQRLNKQKGDPNATDEVLNNKFGLDLNEIKELLDSLEAKKFIYQETNTNQKNLGMRAWKIHSSGEKKVNEIQDDIDVLKNRVQIASKPKFKLEFGHKLTLIGIFLALIVLLFGNNLLGKLTGDESGLKPSENIFLKVNDVYYLTDSSKSETFPDAFKKDDGGVLLSSDDITQNETMKLLWLDRKPIIKFSISNTNATKSFKLLGIYLEINSKECLLKISTQYDKDEPFICPPNSNIEYTGVPMSYPVYRIESDILRLEWKPEESQKLYPLYIQPTKPTEISGRLIVQFEDSTAMTFNQPFRINKKVIKILEPGPSL